MEKWIQHPLIKPQKIESRLYQQIMAADVLMKGNTMIVAPTALGKTIIAVLVAADRISKFKGSKALILAPSKPLVLQHEESFREFLNLGVTTTSLTGEIKPEERIKRWESSQLICATPQTVESDLLSGRYDLGNVSLLVFDECHRGVGSYSYVFLASKYMQTGNNSLILGLTASPGWDEQKIGDVCLNLFFNEVVIKNEDDPDVIPYFNPVKVDWVKVELTEDFKKIKSHLDAALKTRLKTLKRMEILRSISNVSKKDILKKKGMVQSRIAGSIHPPKKYFIAVSILTAIINLQHALELLETQGINSLYQYIQRLRKKKTKASKSLLNDNEFSMAVYLTKKAYRENIDHPKLDKLLIILKKELKNQDSRIIVFSQFRDTVDKIYEKCLEEEINAVRFFGQASTDKTKGLSQRKQQEIIKAFRKGAYDVLISTSVAEEGIDIPAVDLVVLYEPVPSEIRMIQRRGRTGRKNKGKMIILITKNTRDEAYYWSSVHKEDKMKKKLSNGYKRETQIDFRGLGTKSEAQNSPKKDINPVVYVDSRESNSRVLRELHKLNVEIIVKSLAVADYQVSDDVGIERKTTKDFSSSVVDKRLHRQAKELVETFSKPLFIVEGKDLYSGFIHPNAVRGALASVAVDFGIPVIPTRSQEDTAAMIARIAIREQILERPEIQLRTEKKPLTLKEQQIYIIESLPNVGPVTARKLLEEFGSVRGVIKASESELKNIEGIGDIIAKKIKDVVDSSFKSIKTVEDEELIKKIDEIQTE
ncbi:MAG: DEAD/DEAH box helicase [Euryarchaeota archaeon]|nr:DEAD/DEAH box helicase [Euryarchaeota archaeon]